MLWYSLYSKATCFFNGSEQLVVKFVVVLIGRNVNPIETGVGFGQVVGAGINLVDGKKPWASSTLEGLEALQRNSGGAGYKLQ